MKPTKTQKLILEAMRDGSTLSAPRVMIGCPSKFGTLRSPTGMLRSVSLITFDCLIKGGWIEAESGWIAGADGKKYVGKNTQYGLTDGGRAAL